MLASALLSFQRCFLLYFPEGKKIPSSEFLNYKTIHSSKYPHLIPVCKMSLFPPLGLLRQTLKEPEGILVPF